jgi:segregation and condensation protein A
VDIYDIPIALITDQYLAYLDWMKGMNVDLAGEFLVMAATLTQVKSKMLLPVHEGEQEGEDEDPRTAITRPLLEYMQMKSAAELLSQRNLLGHDTFARKPDTEEYLASGGDEMIKVGLFELIDAFQRILDNVSPTDRVELVADRVSVNDKITEIVDILEDKGSAAFSELFESAADKSEVIVTFLAILEMVKLNLIRIVQVVQTGIIRLFYL